MKHSNQRSEQNFAIAALLMSLPLAAQASVELEPPARTRSGIIARMTHAQADAYCADQGLRLPTLRELATHYNPLGVLSSEPTGVRLEAFYTEQRRIHFFYDPSTYQRGRGDSVFEWYWSSTLLPQNEQHAYFFDAAHGEIRDTHREVQRSCAVRCIRD